MSILRDGTKGHLTALRVATESSFNTTRQKVGVLRSLIKNRLLEANAKFLSYIRGIKEELHLQRATKSILLVQNNKYFSVEYLLHFVYHFCHM